MMAMLASGIAMVHWHRCALVSSSRMTFVDRLSQWRGKNSRRHYFRRPQKLGLADTAIVGRLHRQALTRALPKSSRSASFNATYPLRKWLCLHDGLTLSPHLLSVWVMTSLLLLAANAQVIGA
jgi:hypothetical protein